MFLRPVHTLLWELHCVASLDSRHVVASSSNNSVRLVLVVELAATSMPVAS